MKFLFSATFKDGTVMTQDENDVHPTRPDKSQFTYFLEQEKEHGGTVLFQLIGDEKPFLVDLTDGHFERYGNREEATEPFDAETARVVYYRQHTIQLQGVNEIGRDTDFVIGWQCTIDGKNYQQTISIA